MSNFVTLTLLAAFAVVGVISDTPVYQCNNDVSLPLRTQISDCETLPCRLYQGSTIIMNATFNADSYIDQLEPEVIIYMLGEEFNYPFIEPGGCEGLLNSQCPIEEGETATYQLEMPYLSRLPRLLLNLKITLYGDGIPITCFMVDTINVGPDGKLHEV